jgi:hypothetical protein
MLANQRAAAEAGLKHGATGYLNTDWGDHGHLQYLPFSYPGLAAGAAISWCLQSNHDLPLPHALDVHAFADPAGIMGAAICELGNVYKLPGKPIGNRSALFSLLVPSSTHRDPMEGITLDGLEAAQSAIESGIRAVQSSKMNCHDAKLIRSEFANAAAMLAHACKIGRGENRDSFAEELGQIIQSHRQCWLARNRPGGLEESLTRIIHRGDRGAA